MTIGRVCGKSFIKKICDILDIESEGIRRLEITAPVSDKIKIVFYDMCGKSKSSKQLDVSMKQLNVESNEFIDYLSKEGLNTHELFDFCIDIGYNDVVTMRLSHYISGDMLGHAIDYIENNRAMNETEKSKGGSVKTYRCTVCKREQ